MLKYVCLLILLLTCLGLADNKADYEHKLADIQEQKRLLNDYHLSRRYSDAIAQQRVIAEKSEEALKLARRSTEISDDEAWIFHADVLRDIGYSEQALKALEDYLNLPLLDQKKRMEGWKRRAQILRRAKNFEQAKSAYEKAYALAEVPRDEFYLRRELAGLEIAERKLTEAGVEAKAMEAMLPRINESERLRAQRDLQGLLARLYKESGDAAAAHQAKIRELRLRRDLLDKEIQDLERP